jgi:hypothetical protein
VNVELGASGRSAEASGRPRWDYVRSATPPGPCAVIALAGLLEKLRGSGLAIGGSAADAAPQPGRALVVSWRGRFMKWPLIRHVRPVLIVPIAGNAQRCDCCIAIWREGTAVNKYGWSCWLSRNPRRGSTVT